MTYRVVLKERTANGGLDVRTVTASSRRKAIAIMNRQGKTVAKITEAG